MKRSCTREKKQSKREAKQEENQEAAKKKVGLSVILYAVVGRFGNHHVQQPMNACCKLERMTTHACIMEIRMVSVCGSVCCLCGEDDLFHTFCNKQEAVQASSSKTFYLCLPLATKTCLKFQHSIRFGDQQFVVVFTSIVSEMNLSSKFALSFLCFVGLFSKVQYKCLHSVYPLSSITANITQFLLGFMRSFYHISCG